MNSDKIFTILLVIMAILIVGVILIKRFMYFFPTSQFLSGTEKYQNVNHMHLHGWILPGNDPNGKIILFCHGNGGNISHRQEKITALNSMGYAVLIFDYSGFGYSKGTPSEQQCYKDAEIMLSYLYEQKFPLEKIVLYGESLGAPVAAYVAQKYNIPILILESPLPSIKALINAKFPLLSILAPLFTEFDTESHLLKYKGSTMLLHSRTDEIVPYSSGLHLHRLVKQVIPITGGHNSTVIPWVAIKKFVEENETTIQNPTLNSPIPKPSSVTGSFPPRKELFENRDNIGAVYYSSSPSQAMVK